MFVPLQLYHNVLFSVYKGHKSSTFAENTKYETECLSSGACSGLVSFSSVSKVRNMVHIDSTRLLQAAAYDTNTGLSLCVLFSAFGRELFMFVNSNWMMEECEVANLTHTLKLVCVTKQRPSTDTHCCFDLQATSLVLFQVSLISCDTAECNYRLIY